MMKRAFAILIPGVLALTLTAGWVMSDEQPAKAKSSEKAEKEITVRKGALKRARKTVRMLDDVYKMAIVLITDKYVNDEDDYPAGSAFIALFESVEEKGWHKVRLIDVSGEPYNDENVAEDDFEKEGVRQLKAGKDYYEKVVERDGKPYLRAMTAVPVVMEKCIMCHPHYKDAKKGAAIGAVSYTLPIE